MGHTKINCIKQKKKFSLKNIIIYCTKPLHSDYKFMLGNCEDGSDRLYLI